MMNRIRLIGILAAIFVMTATPRAFSSTYEIVVPDSTIEVGVFRGGLLKVFGHDHLIAAKEFSGTARFDPDRMEESSLELTVAAGSLDVLDTGLSEEDRREVEATMLGEEVLDVESFPRIEFRSTGVSEIRQVDAGWEFMLEGMLTLHGVEQPITFPLRVRLEDSRLYGEGEVTLAQSDFGIRPIRIAGGLVRVKDRVRVSFAVVAAQSGS